MKKLFAFLVLGAALVACTRESLPEQEEPREVSKVYTMNVKATKEQDTRALAEDAGTLYAAWTAGDVVSVYENNVKLGELTAGNVSSDGASCTLSGTLDAAPDGTSVTLKYHTPDYSSQTGTLAYIADNCDYAEAVVNVTVNGTDVTAGEATFESKQAIVKFTLKEGDTPITASAFSVHDGTNTWTVQPGEDAGVLYVAVPGFSGQTVTLTATVNGVTYIYKKAGLSFVNGQYYAITVKMYPETVDLSTVTTADLTVKDGQILTGTLDAETNQDQRIKITIADGATVTLSGARIIGYYSNPNFNYNWAGLNCAGDATIILDDGTQNEVNGIHPEQSGIRVPANKTLTINANGNGTGELVARSYYSAAGIGASAGDDPGCGHIVINGGVITAIGGEGWSTYGYGGAGIGGATDGHCGTITINGGTITATGGSGAAGIGSGGNSRTFYTASCGDITITGGQVTATGGYLAAGIGSGYSQGHVECGKITISGGDVSATSGTPNAKIQGPAGIGCGVKADCGDVLISGGAVCAEVSQGPGACIGAFGERNNSNMTGKIEITKGATQVIFKRNVAGAYIGGASRVTTGTITIDGITINSGSVSNTNANDYSSSFPHFGSNAVNYTWTLTRNNVE